jgi:hypothetical protein
MSNHVHSQLQNQREANMRITAYAVSLLLTATSVSAQVASQGTKTHDAVEEREMFATNRCFSKGGLGIVNTNLYIAVKSARNELLLGEKETWSGLDAARPEVVVFFENRVWVSENLPKGFDLSKAVVVSFEGSKIRFFDFQTMSGCYYDRIGS